MRSEQLDCDDCPDGQQKANPASTRSISRPHRPRCPSEHRPCSLTDRKRHDHPVVFLAAVAVVPIVEEHLVAALKAERAGVAAKGHQAETEVAPIRYVTELLSIDTEFRAGNPVVDCAHGLVR
jgi:hypothetical protein